MLIALLVYTSWLNIYLSNVATVAQGFCTKALLKSSQLRFVFELKALFVFDHERKACRESWIFWERKVTRK